MVELMVTLTVLAVLLVIGVPAYNKTILGNRLGGYANSFVSATHLARSEAIKRNAAVKICVANAGGTGCTTGGWQQGWIVFVDQDDDGNVDAGTDVVISRQQRLSQSDVDVVRFARVGTPAVEVIRYISTGETDLTESIEFKVCALPAGSRQPERFVTMDSLGRARVKTPESDASKLSGTCS